VLCSTDFPIHVIDEFKAQILSLDLSLPITIGEKIILHVQSQKTPGTITKIDKLFNKSGEVVKSNSK